MAIYSLKTKGLHNSQSKYVGQLEQKVGVPEKENHCTKVRFASFLSGGFITAIAVNLPERKLAKCTSVHCMKWSPKKSTTSTQWKILKIWAISPTVHRGAFCQFPFRWIYYYSSNKSTGKETGKTHLCVV